ncbi:helix-turn-helix transcriptional regulator [Vibrio genomosp. F10]
MNGKGYMVEVANKNTESKAFASKTMLNILNAGLNTLLDDSLLSPAQPFIARQLKTNQSQAHVPLETKRDFINEVSQRYGASALLCIGIGVKQFIDSPVGRALLNGSDPFLLLKKWQRLERYVHSQHFVDFEYHDDCVKVTHKSNTTEMPSIEEDLAVLGVLCALLYESSARKIAISHSLDASESFFSYPSLQCDPSQLHRDAPWYIHFQVRDKKNPKIKTVEQSVTNNTLSMVNRAKQTIMDLGLLEVDLQQVSRCLALSPRSLQRKLSDEGHSFAKLLQDVRVHFASQSLLDEASCIAEVGFVSGFADQAHFTRVFKQWTGMSPKQYTQFKS